MPSPNAQNGAGRFALPRAAYPLFTRVLRLTGHSGIETRISRLPFLLFFFLVLTNYQAWSRDFEDAPDAENLVLHGRWRLDESGTQSLADVWPARADQFTAYAGIPQKIPRGAALWAVFRPEDISIKPEHSLWYAATICDYFQVFRLDKGHLPDSSAAGSMVKHGRLPFRDNFMAIPFIQPAGSTEVFLLKFQNVGLRRLEVKEVFLLTEKEESAVRAEFQFTRTAQDHYFFIFLGVTGFLFILFLLEWRVKRLHSLLFYCLYLVSCGLYYLRILENSQFEFRPLFKHLGQGQHPIEVVIAFCSYSFYMAFVSQFLELPRYLPRIARFLHWGAFFFAAAIPAMLLIEELGSPTIMKVVFLYVRIAFFLMSFFIIGLLWKKHRAYPMTKFIAIGTSFLVLGMVMTLSPEMFGGELRKDILGGAFGWYVNASGTIRVPVYDFKFGVLLEIVIFSTGLAYREELLAQSFAASRKADTEGLPGGGEMLFPFPMDSPFVKSTVDLVQKNLADENFRVEELAAAMSISRESLYLRIKRETGMDTTTFIRTIRLWEGRRMLERNDLSISEVAYAVGFRHPYYFSRKFKEEFGRLPSEVLRQKNN